MRWIARMRHWRESLWGLIIVGFFLVPGLALLTEKVVVQGSAEIANPTSLHSSSNPYLELLQRDEQEQSAAEHFGGRPFPSTANRSGDHVSASVENDGGSRADAVGSVWRGLLSAGLLNLMALGALAAHFDWLTVALWRRTYRCRTRSGRVAGGIATVLGTILFLSACSLLSQALPGQHEPGLASILGLALWLGAWALLWRQMKAAEAEPLRDRAELESSKLQSRPPRRGPAVSWATAVVASLAGFFAGAWADWDLAPTLILSAAMAMAGLGANLAIARWQLLAIRDFRVWVALSVLWGLIVLGRFVLFGEDGFLEPRQYPWLAIIPAVIAGLAIIGWRWALGRPLIQNGPQGSQESAEG